MNAILKRLINAIFIFALLFMLVFSGGIILSDGVVNWVAFFEAFVIPLILVFLCILAANYIIFGRLTMFHKNID